MNDFIGQLVSKPNIDKELGVSCHIDCTQCPVSGSKLSSTTIVGLHGDRCCVSRSVTHAHQLGMFAEQEGFILLE